MRYEVVYSQRAKANLLKIARYVGKQSSPRIAEGYIERIRAHCRTLHMFPQRGGDLSAAGLGLRFEGFDRSVTIVFRIQEQRVTIVAVLYRGRDIENRVRDEHD